MYICEKHGEQETDWCEECEILLSCDCSDLEETRFKDLRIDSNSGEKTFTIYVEHCINCGNVFDSRIG